MELNEFIYESKKLYFQLLSSEELINLIKKVTKVCKEALTTQKKIILCGNGGSAADSQHIAAELVSRFSKDREALSAVSLTTDTSNLTAIANDYGFENVFSRQIEALGHQGDVLIAFSTSGNSPNIIKAAKQAKKQGLKTIVLTGKKTTELHNYADISFFSNSEFTPIVQQTHLFFGHALCLEIENQLFCD